MTGFGREENVIDTLTIKRGEDWAGLEGQKLNVINRVLNGYLHSVKQGFKHYTRAIVA